MLRRLSLVSLLVLALASFAVHGDEPAPVRTYVVILHSADSPRQDVVRNKHKRIADARVKEAIELGQRHGVAVDLFALFPGLLFADMTAQQAAAMAADPAVKLVEEDPVIGRIPDVPPHPDEIGEGEGLGLRLFAEPTSAWNLDRIDERTLPLDGLYAPSGAGAGVRIYVFDSGIKRDIGAVQSELGSRLMAGWDANKGSAAALPPEEFPNDTSGHGTWVSIVAAGRTRGVATGARIVPVKVTDTQNRIQMGTFANALEQLLARHGQGGGVVNMSFELLPGTNQNIIKRINDAAGVLREKYTFVFGAGNSGLEACKVPENNNAPSHPLAALEQMQGVLVVGATDISDKEGVFAGSEASNWGSCIGLWAPGVDIPVRTTIRTRFGDIERRVSGTSFAAPHVSGAAALYGIRTGAQIESALISDSTKNVLTGRAPGHVVHNRLLYVGSEGSGGGGAGTPADLIAVQPVSPPPILFGDSATLSVGLVDGLVNPRFTWYSGPRGNVNASIPVGVGRTVTVTPAVTTSYWVRVTSNGRYDDSDAALVTIFTRTITAVSFNLPAVCAGGTAIGTVTLDGPAGRFGAPVTLDSSSVSVDVPAEITIPAGATSATFTAGTIAGPFAADARITATNEDSMASAVITVQPSVLRLIIQPSTIDGGRGALATVQLTGPAPAGGAVVSLASSDSGAARVPASITIPAGISTGVFVVTTTGVRARTSVEITASLCGTAAQLVTVVPSSCLAPVVAAEPRATQTIEYGGSAPLEVGADGTAPLTYEWLTTAGIPAGTGRQITVAPLVTTGYVVRIRNACGAAESRTAIVTVVCNAAAITEQPQDASIVAGDRAELRVAATGTQPIEVHWFTADGAFAGSGAVLPVSPAATASYYARLSSPCGQVQSRVATVTVCAPAQITAGPAASMPSITEGDPVTLTASASGTARISYRWIDSAGATVGSGPAITITPGSTNSYRVTAGNSCGTATSGSVTVVVNPRCIAPSVGAHPQSQEIVSGSSATLTVAASGTAPLAIEWFTAGGTAAGFGASITVSPTATTAYFARVTNACGTIVSEPATITVTQPCAAPSIATHPQSQSIIAGSSATLTVAANGTAPLTIEWFTAGGASAGFGASITVSPTATTAYFARVTNTCGVIASDAATVTVTQPCAAPSIATHPQSQEIVSGASATLAVAVNGTEPLAIEWFTTGGASAGFGASITVSPTATTAYFARIANTCGTIVSEPATITVTQPCAAPSIAMQPQSHSIIAGSSVTLTVAANGTAPLTIEWFTAGGASAGFGASITVSPAATTAYFARITNTCGTIVSEPATITVTQLCAAPSIATHPQSQSIIAGSSATLSVAANGTAPLTIEWFTAGGAAAGFGASITVSPTVTTTYFARITNACGTIVSDPGTITVTQPCAAPSIATHPQSVSIIAGSAATLSVAANGTAPLTIQWFTSSGAPAGSGASITVFPTATTAYVARVSNACGTIDSATATITVTQPCVAPSITTHPQSQSIIGGSSATLTVAANGTAPLSIQWFTTGGASAGFGASITVFPTATTAYVARVSNACGTIDSATATITVTQPCVAPSITTHPQPQSIIAGSAATLTVAANGTAPLTIQWFTSSGTLAGTGASITVSPTATTAYFARVTNACGTADSATATVIVTQPCVAPSVTMHPQSQSIIAGSSATLTVAANGTAPLSIEWFTTGGAPAGTGASITVFPTATTAYVARISNACGTIDSATATITVTQLCVAPSITTHPQSQSIIAGSSATLTVAANGTAPLTIQWFTSSGAPAGSGASITVSPTATTAYFARVTNACGTIDSATATVNVTQPCTLPQIVEQPEDVLVMQGLQATISVGVVSSTPVAYQWFVFNAPIPGATGASYTFTPSASTNYFASVTNACGTVASTPVLVAVANICVEAEITAQPQPVSIATGQSTTLSVAASGSSLSYQWYETGGIPVAGATSRRLTVSPSSTRTYYVEVTTPCNSVVSDAATVTVH
jgi:Ig-like domain CHU_C associated